MAQNITLMNASYSAVPAVTLPKTGGGTATFTDTSDADATAGDIASGKTAYVNGVKITGTGGGGGTSWETVFNQSISITNQEGNYYYRFYQPFTETFTQDSVWRVTWGATTYICTATHDGSPNFSHYAIGDPGIVGGTSSGNNEPFFIGDVAPDYLVVVASQSQTINLKLEKQVSGGGGSTLITKTITANGTYDAEDDDADGYSSVTVNVAGAISNTVTGTFQFDSTKKGTAQEITLNYSGAGYPIAVMIYPSEGAANASGTAYTRLQRNSQFIYMAIKSFQTGSDATPTYNGSGNNNLCSVVSRYKSSSSNASSLSANATSDYTYNNANASASYSSCVKFKSATKMSVFIANTSYGFLDSVDYRYVIQYSS